MYIMELTDVFENPHDTNHLHNMLVPLGPPVAFSSVSVPGAEMSRGAPLLDIGAVPLSFSGPPQNPSMRIPSNAGTTLGGNSRRSVA